VFGVCNGFQVLTETGLLPGALLRNAGLKYICKHVELNVETTQSAYTSAYKADQSITIPIAHHDGNYNLDDANAQALFDQDRVAFTYADNPNGSVRSIAGVLSENRRVLGMMPHPERLADPAQGGTDGQPFFAGLMDQIATV
jgi:phosphoribosylformylglycinamidine synthase